MLNWLKNKIENKLNKSNINRSKKDMDEFLIYLRESEETNLKTIVHFSEQVARLYMKHTGCNLYAPLSSLEKEPELDMHLIADSQKANERGDHQLAKAYELWVHTLDGVRYFFDGTDDTELARLSLQIWAELDRAGERLLPEWPDEMLDVLDEN